MTEAPDASIEELLLHELERSDAAAETIVPILRHLVLGGPSTLFSDEIVAHVRGMVASVAAQCRAMRDTNVVKPNTRNDEYLTNLLLGCEQLVQFCHHLIIERKLAERLDACFGIDPVLTPMLQALIASDDSDTQSVAMRVLAAQARFLQHQKRMELSIAELSEQVFEDVLATLSREKDADTDKANIERLRGVFNDGQGRLTLLDRLIASLGKGARAALSIDHAGAALFLSALSCQARLDRGLAVLSTTDRQSGRLILALRACGLKSEEVTRQFGFLVPDRELPETLGQLRVDRAQTLLHMADARLGGRS